jgi:serine/threonine protein kinase
LSEENESQAFGPYTLLERIAVGGMAEVWRARARGMAGFEKILVIKRVLDALSADEEFIRLFIDEARIAVALVHVNIVQVFELGEIEGSYYMAMEWVQGIDLSQLATKAQKRGPFRVSLALFIVGEVLKALQFAHERTDDDDHPLRIVHCDISPQNVLISFAGEVKLTDFGISRAAFQSKGANEVIRGKYAYMSPEQVEGEPLDGRSDLFSIGIVLYELLTGRRLFKGKTREETLARVRRAEVPSPRAYRPEISEDLEAFLLKALAQKPEKRFADAATMLEALGRLMVQEGHRSTNNELAAFLREALETKAPTAEELEEHATMPLVVLAAEASPLPKALGTPKATIQALAQEWAGIAQQGGGEIWERGEGSLLVCWTGPELPTSLQKAVETSLALKKSAEKVGYRLSAGIAPGTARLQMDTKRPAEGWELAGPFYLARWMMNLSAHRGRTLITEVGARQVAEHKPALLGRISILGNRFISLYELGG